MFSFPTKKSKILTASLALLLLLSFNSVRTFFENIYIGAPPIILFNKIRPYLGDFNSEQCYAKLRSSGLKYLKLRGDRSKDGCFFTDMLAIKRPLKEKRYMTCSLALAIHKYYSYVLQPLAESILETKLLRIIDKGVRSCRTMTGHKFLLSEHAYANAIDISAFEFENGLIIDVEKDWKGTDIKATFLKDVAKKACKIFNMTISPDRDEFHEDHLHLDMGLSKGCY